MLILGDVDNQELIAMKRVPYVHQHRTVSLAFYTPVDCGNCIYTLYFMSDCYLGMDQQYDLCFKVIPSSLQAQVNTEISDEDTRGS